MALGKFDYAEILVIYSLFIIVLCTLYSWAYAATAVVEYAQCVKTGKRVSLRY